MPYISNIGRVEMATIAVEYRVWKFPSIIQPPFVWQEELREPAEQRVRRFVDYWQKNIEGDLAHVYVASNSVLRDTGFRYVDFLTRLN